MAVHIKLIRNNIKSSSSYGKYFAKAVSQGEVTMSELAEEAAINSGKGAKNGHILYDFCEGVKAVWQTGFKP